MSGLPKKAYLITLNNKNICVLFCSGSYALLIKDEMRMEHFENIFGMPISPKTASLEEQYEKEYRWDYIELDYLGTAEAETRALAIMERNTKEL